MARDIRELFKEEDHVKESMPDNHEARFLDKLDQDLPVAKPKYKWFGIAASVVVLLGLGVIAFKFYNASITSVADPSGSLVKAKPNNVKALGDVSPGLKKVEDYYLASINLELAKIKYTPETKELFDGYVKQLEELDKEYQRLLQELTDSGPSELAVNALIDNLKFRLNLLYRLRTQLEELNTSNEFEEHNQSI